MQISANNGWQRRDNQTPPLDFVFDGCSSSDDPTEDPHSRQGKINLDELHTIRIIFE